MEPAGCTPSPDESDPSLTHQHLEDQLVFFHKLGYSTAQVEVVLKQCGPETDRNQVLGALVRMKADPSVCQEPLTTLSVSETQNTILSTESTGTSPPLTTFLVPVTQDTIPSTESTGMLPPGSPTRKDGGDDKDALRPIVIDGSNVAMSHGNNKVFSCMGIQLAVDFFLERGHTAITVFVPSWRKEHPRPDVPISDQHILVDLERKKYLTFTPSRRVRQKRVICNDDKFIVQLAFDTGGIIVSNDVYHDLQVSKPEWNSCIEERLLMYSFVNDKFMVPDDPLGRDGPNLENFLRWSPKTQKKPPCPYRKKCTFGLKCKYLHPERVKQSNWLLADELRENAKVPSVRSPVPSQSLSLAEDVARTLTLGLEKSPLKKDKAIHYSKQQVSCRKGKNSLDSSEHGSPKQLDSGIGSMENKSVEAQQANCHAQYEPPSGKSHPMPTCHLWSAPCRCYIHYFAFSQSFAKQQLSHSLTPVYRHSADMALGESRRRATYRDERKVTRTKLLAIFSADLVDAAMNMFPSIVDPQMLAAKIIMMKSQNKMS
ncbi:endoribonuclease ZC3H12A [Hippocampus zosterae]|uniref:endoribonuclease ZC3H12A n=1 Tax=Hippocampus zosterae TaxID=109293 RepID=UPI00223DF3A3|nr:endoribonuclease ZC3H12A [Hippocampus zosterae]